MSANITGGRFHSDGTIISLLWLCGNKVVAYEDIIFAAFHACRPPGAKHGGFFI